MISFTVPGTPRGKERVAQAGRYGQKHRYAATSSKAEETGIGTIAKRAMKGQPPLTCPVQVQIVAVFQTPKSWKADLQQAAAEGRVYHTAKPDRDNIDKLVCDALKGICWHDDSQVSGGGTWKRYGSPARIEVRIDPMLGAPDTPKTPSELRREANAEAVAMGRLLPKRKPHNAITDKRPVSTRGTTPGAGEA